MTPDDCMRRIDALLSHVWMVRTFIKHSEEAEDDDELMEIVRTLYDYTLAVGPAWSQQNAADYLRTARKKFSKLKQALEQFAELQPQVSDHTNFKMAVASLRTAVIEIGCLLDDVRGAGD